MCDELRPSPGCWSKKGSRVCVLPGDRPLAEPAALDGAKSQAQWVVRAQPLPSGQCLGVQSPESLGTGSGTGDLSLAGIFQWSMTPWLQLCRSSIGLAHQGAASTVESWGHLSVSWWQWVIGQRSQCMPGHPLD